MRRHICRFPVLFRSHAWTAVATAVLLLAISLAFMSFPASSQGRDVRRDGPPRPEYHPKSRTHLDHAPFFADSLESPQAVTRACLECHPQAAGNFMQSSHWQWLGEEITVPGHDKPQRIGKKNLLNNFCISITGNYAR